MSTRKHVDSYSLKSHLLELILACCTHPHPIVFAFDNYILDEKQIAHQPKLKAVSQICTFQSYLKL